VDAITHHPSKWGNIPTLPRTLPFVVGSPSTLTGTRWPSPVSHTYSFSVYLFFLDFQEGIMEEKFFEAVYEDNEEEVKEIIRMNPILM